MIRKHKYYKPKHRQYNLPTQNRNMRQPQIEKKVNMLIIKKIISIIFFCACFAWFFYFFLLSDNFFIKTIKISGNENIPKNDLEEIVKEELKEKKWLIFPGKNILLFNKQNLISDIQNKYITENIKISKKLPFTILIELEEKLARVVLRTKTPISITQDNTEDVLVEDEQNIINPDDVSHNIEDREQENENREEVEYSEDYYYLDVNGIVISSSLDAQNDLLKFPVIEIETKDQAKINSGDIILSREKIEFVFEAYEMIHRSKENISVAYVVLDLDIDNEITFVTQEGWQGFLSTQVSLETQIKKLELALQEKIKDKRATLQYVDLRIKDRVYFK